MWFLIGIITTIGCIIYFFQKKIKASWEGIGATCNGLAYEYHIVQDNDQIKKIKLGIKIENEYDFQIKLEKWHDRLFKTLRLSVEFQLGNQEFDKKYYLVSDNVSLLESISKAGELHDVIDKVFDSPKYCALTKKLQCNSKRLWLEYHCDESFSEGDIGEIAMVIVPLLKNIADHPSLATIEARSGFDRYALRAAIILGVSTGLAVNGLVHLVRMPWAPFIVVDTYQLMLDGFLIAAVIVGFLIFGTISFLGRTSRAHLVFIEVLFIGGIGAFLTSTEELSDFNKEMDRQAAQEFTVQVHKKTTQYHRKIGRRGRSSNSYYLHINDWLNSEKEKKVGVSSHLYSQVREGDSIIVFQKPGRLGYRWVEKISKAKPAE